MKTVKKIIIILSMPFTMVFGVIISPYIWLQLCVQSYKKLSELFNV